MRRALDKLGSPWERHATPTAKRDALADLQRGFFGIELDAIENGREEVFEVVSTLQPQLVGHAAEHLLDWVFVISASACADASSLPREGCGALSRNADPRARPSLRTTGARDLSPERRTPTAMERH
jgi:hypothetical protein